MIWFFGPESCGILVRWQGLNLHELVKADIFVSVTAVPNVYINYGILEQGAIGRVTVDEMDGLKKFGHFKVGSMLPKVEATVAFAKKGGTGIITDIDNLKMALIGKAGTIVQK